MPVARALNAWSSGQMLADAIPTICVTRSGEAAYVPVRRSGHLLVGDARLGLDGIDVVDVGTAARSRRLIRIDNRVACALVQQRPVRWCEASGLPEEPALSGKDRELPVKTETVKATNDRVISACMSPNWLRWHSSEDHDDRARRPLGCFRFPGDKTESFWMVVMMMRAFRSSSSCFAETAVEVLELLPGSKRSFAHESGGPDPLRSTTERHLVDLRQPTCASCTI